MDEKSDYLKNVKLQNLVLSDIFDLETLILSSLGESVAILSIDKRYLYWNHAFEELTGIHKEDAIGKKPDQVFPGLAYKDSYILLDKIKIEKTTTVEPTVFFKFNNREIWINRKIFPILTDGEVIGFAVIISDVTRQKNDEIKIEKQIIELEKINKQLSIELNERMLLEKKIREIEETEQNRIAMNIHDSIGQHITGIRYLLGQLILNMNKEKSPYESHLTSILGLLDETKGMIRDLACSSRLLLLSPSDFDKSLIQMLNKIEKIFPVCCTHHLEMHNMIGSGKEYDLFFLIQELITNLIKHGQAKKIDLVATAEPDKIIIEIKHDGILHIKMQQEHSVGMGQKIMNYRLAKIKGTIAIENLETGENIYRITTENKLI